MIAKNVILDYARYRRMGYSMVDSLDISLTRANVIPILAGRVREKRTSKARAELRLVK